MITGFRLNKVLLQGHWVSSMVGFNLCFFPMHYLGMYGLPRRVCGFDQSFLWLQVTSTTGALVSVIRAFFLLFVL